HRRDHGQDQPAAQARPAAERRDRGHREGCRQARPHRSGRAGADHQGPARRPVDARRGRQDRARRRLREDPADARRVIMAVTEAGRRVAGHTAARGRPFWTIPRRDALVGYLLIAPQLIGSALFVLLPLGLVVWYSLQEWNVLAGTFEFVGGENYAKQLADPIM